MRSIIKSKVFAVLLCISMLMTLVPAINVQAASDNQVKASISADSQTVNEDGTVKVTISLEGIPYQGKVNPTDVILVIDRSLSMDTKLDKMKEAAKAFIDSIDTSTHRIGIVVYDTDVISYALSTDKTKLKEYVDKIKYQGLTNISSAIDESVKLLKSKRSNAQGAIVLMTDGIANYYGNPPVSASEDISLAAAVSSAEKAKASGYVFYTVALCNSENADENKNLKKMATSEADHYFTNVDGLVTVYEQISAKIGYANAQNVVISQYIGEQFEYVTGSADNTIPVPYVDGQKLIWKMNQLGKGTSTLSYEIKVKDTTTEGTYQHVSTGAVVYTDYNGNSRSILLDKIPITVKKHAPELTTINQTEFDVNGGENVLIQGKYITDGATVKIGDTIVSNAIVANNVISFVMPKHSIGTDTITVINPDKQVSNALSVKFVSSAPLPTLTLSPDSGLKTESPKVTASGVIYKASSAKELKVTVGSTNVQVLSYNKNTGNVIFRIPKANTAGAVNVIITDKDGQKYTAQYLYKDKTPVTPIITSITPDSGDIAETPKVTIQGANFKNGSTTVTVGGTVVTILSCTDTTLVFRVPKATSAGAQAVVVTRTDQKTSATTTYSYTTTPPNPITPIITSITPDSGDIAETPKVTIQGANFKNGSTTVTVGGNAVTILSCTDTTLVFRVPKAISAGAQAVVVTRTDQKTSATTTYSYTATIPNPITPTITSITPDSGDVAETPKVTILGTNFKSGSTTVTVGGTEVTILSCTETTLVFRVPKATSAGAQTVAVTRTDQKTSATTTYSYTATTPNPITPTITSITPDSGDIAETPKVTIVGTNFENGSTTVTVGGTEVTILSCTDTTLVFRVPKATSAGARAVVVTRTDQKTSATTTYNYTNIPPVSNLQITKITPNSGVAGTSQKVTITGSGFEEGGSFSIMLGTVQLQPLSVTDTSIVVRIPDTLAEGKYPLKIVNRDGTTKLIPDAYECSAPISNPKPKVTSMTPANGTAMSSYKITLSGENFKGTSKASIVTFAGQTMTLLSNTDTTLIFRVPKVSAGTYDIVITNSYGEHTTIKYTVN